MKYLKGCTRVEVIDNAGRSYVNWNADNQVQISMQDNDRTLKVFVSGPASISGYSKADKDACVHPFKRLQWVKSTVYCNQCGTTLVRNEEDIDRANDILHELNKNRKPE